MKTAAKKAKKEDIEMRNLPKEITENGIHYTLHSAKREKFCFFSSNPSLNAAFRVEALTAVFFGLSCTFMFLKKPSS